MKKTTARTTQNKNLFLARIAGEAVLVSPNSRDRFETCLVNLGTFDFEKAKAAQAEQDDDFWPKDQTSFLAFLRPYIVKDGLLMIPVKGALVSDFPYQFSSYATGYEYIQKAFERGMDDGNVKGIALVIDSPGGEVAGNFDLVDRMYARRGEKPVKAYASESAYSAAYSIASVADSITVTRTGGVGSIGVLTAHIDMSAAMDQFGYKITFIHAGKHKVDGNPYEELSPKVKARIQKRIDGLYDIFVATVARNRGMDEQAVRDTEALTYSATDSLSVGLADNIGSLDDGLVAFATDLNNEEGTPTMTDPKKVETAIDQNTVDAAHATGVTAGATAERARISAILTSENAVGREASAQNVALETDMSAEQAIKFLATVPVATKEAPAAEKKNAFEEAMNNSQQPEVAAGSEEGKNKDKISSEDILADYRAQTGNVKSK